MARTIEQFREEMRQAHTCEKSNNMAICIGEDEEGNRTCAYCGKIVNYPMPTIIEILVWSKMPDAIKYLRELYGIEEIKEDWSIKKDIQ